MSGSSGFKEIARRKAVIACAPSHPLVRRSTLKLTDIASYPWIAPPADSPLYEDLRAAWHALKDVLLNAGANRRLAITRLNSATEGLRSYLKMAEQMTKAAVRLRALNDTKADEAEVEDAAA